MNCIIPDTSAVIIGAISEILETEDIDYPEIIVPEAVVCELEHQANANRSEGIRGLKELQKLQKLQYEGELSISFKGKRPTNYDIKYAKSGEIDSIIRDLARSEMGTLLTNDKVQAETAKAQGIPVYFFKQTYKEKLMVRGKKPIDFVSHRKVFFGISLAIILIGIVCNFIFGTTLDIQFTGGSDRKSVV